jgi:hypothetical protein
MEKFRLSIGDWSGDGHSHSEDFVYSSNYPVEALQQAYKDSCKLTGLQFNYNENYSGLKDHDGYGTKRHICTEYQEGELTSFAKKTLQEHGIDTHDFETDGCTDNFAKLILDFIALSMPKDFDYAEEAFKKSELKDGTIKPLNGWWNNKLNVQFGYGIMGD